MMNKTIFMLRDEHAAKHDDGETCGDVEEHVKLFSTTPNPRPKEDENN